MKRKCSIILRALVLFVSFVLFVVKRSFGRTGGVAVITAALPL